MAHANWACANDRMMRGAGGQATGLRGQFENGAHSPLPFVSGKEMPSRVATFF